MAHCTINRNTLILAYEVLLEQELLIIRICLLFTQSIRWLPLAKISLFGSRACVHPIEAVVEAAVIQDGLPSTTVTESGVFLLHIGALKAWLYVVRLESLLVEGLLR